MKKCNTCGGEYEPVQPDGSSYFHACPPVPEYFDGNGTPIDRDTATSLMKAGQGHYVRYVDRLNKRDENPPVTRDAKGKVTMKAEGAGASDIVPPRAPLEGVHFVAPAEPFIP